MKVELKEELVRREIIYKPFIGSNIIKVMRSINDLDIFPIGPNLFVPSSLVTTLTLKNSPYFYKKLTLKYDIIHYG